MDELSKDRHERSVSETSGLENNPRQLTGTAKWAVNEGSRGTLYTIANPSVHHGGGMATTVLWMTRRYTTYEEDRMTEGNDGTGMAIQEPALSSDAVRH
jgi:hypothetical protein